MEDNGALFGARETEREIEVEAKYGTWMDDVGNEQASAPAFDGV